ncbi:MAG: ABC transporter permease [Thermodesulforhabdaceae bacterium]
MKYEPEILETTRTFSGVLANLKSKIPFILLLLLAFLIFGLPLTGIIQDPYRIDLSHRLLSPSREFPLGTDALGRCLLSRTVIGGKITIISGLFATVLAASLGTIMALISMIRHSIIRETVTLIMDSWLAFPDLLLVFMLTLIFGDSISGLIISLALAVWPWWGRFVRNLLLVAYAQEHVIASRVAGVGSLRLFRFSVLPQILPPLGSAFFIRSARSIVLFGGVGFLGLGMQPPMPEWGAMVRDSMPLILGAPWMIIGPAVGFTIVVAIFQWCAVNIRNFTNDRGYSFL